jgi:hypothetical protein
MEEAILHARMLIRYQKDAPQAREQQIHDLMDATENIVTYLLRHDHFWTLEGCEDKRTTMLSYLETYDDRWSKTEHGTSLLRCYAKGCLALSQERTR